MASDVRHAWFVQFEREFRQNFEKLCRARGITLRAQASEAEWKVWVDAPDERDISMMLPHNYGMFQPLAVAVNAATRLHDMVDTTARKRLTPQ